MKRNRGVDLIRSMALLLVLVYHFYVLQGECYKDFWIIHKLISAGGEVGVTLFFILSGYGIFLSIDSQKKRGKFSFKTFFLHRAERILPQYYLSLLLIFFLTGHVTVFSNAGIFNLITHALLIHNLFPSTCGYANSVLWTMGVIAQFYLISIWLYKMVKKNPKTVLFVSIGFTVLCKFVIYHLIFPRASIEPSYYFIYGRQLFTALDNFMIGMFLGIYSERKIKNHNVMLLSGMILMAMWIVIPGSLVKYSDTALGYIWHSILAVLLGVIIKAVAEWNFDENSIITKFIAFIAKYQYGIYIWHFVIASNLLLGSTWIQAIAGRSFIAVCVVLTVICTIVGYISTITLEAPDYKHLWSKKRC